MEIGKIRKKKKVGVETIKEQSGFTYSTWRISTNSLLKIRAIVIRNMNSYFLDLILMAVHCSLERSVIGQFALLKTPGDKYVGSDNGKKVCALIPLYQWCTDNLS